LTIRCSKRNGQIVIMRCVYPFAYVRTRKPSYLASVPHPTLHPAASTLPKEVDDVVNVEGQYLLDVDIVVIAVVSVVLIHGDVGRAWIIATLFV